MDELEPVTEVGLIWLDHTWCVLSASDGKCGLRPAHSDKPTTIPNQSGETHEFTVTHPFHPLSGQTFPILSCRSAWGEPRVQYLAPGTEQVCSLPLAWTSLAPSDPFVELAQGRALLRLTDLQALSVRLRELSAEPAASGVVDNRPHDTLSQQRGMNRWYSK